MASDAKQFVVELIEDHEVDIVTQALAKADVVPTLHSLHVLVNAETVYLNYNLSRMIYNHTKEWLEDEFLDKESISDLKATAKYTLLTARMIDDRIKKLEAMCQP